MGYLHISADGSTLRGWYGAAQDVPLAPGESYELWAAPVADLSAWRWNGTTLVAHTPTAAEVDAAAATQVDAVKLDKALALWVVDEVNALRAAVVPALTPITAAQARNRIIAKYKALP